MVSVRVFIQKLTTLSASGSRDQTNVKDGHFAVIAQKGSERKRFFLKLEWLNNPEFLRLLKMAEDEYGFDQTGVIVVPCTPQELVKILMAAQ